MRPGRIIVALLMALTVAVAIEEQTNCDYSAAVGDIPTGYYNEFSLCIGSQLSWSHDGAHNLAVDTVNGNSTTVTIDGRQISLILQRPEINIAGVFIKMSGTDYSKAVSISLRTDGLPSEIPVSQSPGMSNIWNFNFLVLPVVIILTLAFIYLTSLVLSKQG